MSNRLSFCIFFSSFCVIVFFLQPSRILYYIIIMCVHFTYQFVRVDVCVCARARGAPFVSFQLFFSILYAPLVLFRFHTSTTSPRTHARTLVGTRLSPVCTYQLYTHTYLPYVYTPLAYNNNII